MTANPSAVSRPAVRGVDLSHNNAVSNWPAFRSAGCRFVTLKATEGTTFKDPAFRSYLHAAREQEMEVSALHYFTPTYDATAQAHFFLKTVSSFKGMLPPVLDLEKAGGMSVRAYQVSVQAWLTQVEKATGRPPIIYTYPWFAETYLQGFGRYPLFIAAWQPRPAKVTGWSSWTLWQYAGDRADHPYRKAISEPLDLDRFCGSMDELRAMRL